ncbi:MAG: MBL fold metallo-hydrolase [Desulfobacterales bacterium]|nr:MBL fold metallo-hydrolase [Desulfobacterales bacterium]
MKKISFGPILCILLAIGLSFTTPLNLKSAEIKDAESATHGTQAAAYSIIDTYTFAGYKVIQFELPVLSTYSYMLVSDGDALVVDPCRDIFIYLETAEKKNVTIKGVYLSHSHADFIAGHTEMVQAVNCPIYQSKKSSASYKIKPLADGTTIKIGKATLKFIDTPGHTPDGMCALAYGEDNANTPDLMFTGDVLFVGSVGRPDLMEGTTSAARLAASMFESWNNKISKFPDHVKIFPAHGAGSLCGAHLSDEPFSTIGKEKTSNPYLKYDKKNEFIAALLEGLPEAPQYFKHNAGINKAGPALVDWDAPLPAEISANKNLMNVENNYLVDIRDAKNYAAGHIPNAVNIGLRGRFETWVGIMVPWSSNLVLCGNKTELKEALYRLHRVGYSAGILTLQSWERADLSLSRSPSISPHALYDLMQKGESPIIVDVRLPAEWMALKIGMVLNLPLNHLSDLSSQLDLSEPVVTVCNSAYRSSMAVGVLERNGFKSARSLEGGSQAWIDAGLPVFEAAKTISAATTASKRYIKLPERISASELKRLLMDLPGTFDLIDIRPPEYFTDYNIAGSINVDVAELIANPTYLVGSAPLIILDRDGSLAMAVGGILSQKTKRPIKVLYKGLEAYWSETEGATGYKPGVIQPTTPFSQTPTTIAPAAPSTPAKPQPPKTPKKSAGC